jgi:hypothetical protein
MADLPTPSAKNETGEFDRFNNFLTRLVAVPHSEIKRQLDAEKRAKTKAKKAAAYRAAAASSKKAD